MMERFRSLPLVFQVTTVLALLAICGCCGIVDLALVWPTAGETPDRAAERSIQTLQPTFTPIVSADIAMPPTVAPQPEPERTEAKVVGIVDGDTIEVTIAGEPCRLRYIGIDSPEVGDPMGAEAAAANSDLVAGQAVYLEKDVSETDRYDRLLRYVYLADGIFVNAELVRLGFVVAVEYPPDTKYKKLFLQMEEAARTAGHGFWAPTALPPTATPQLPAPTEPSPTETVIQPTQPLPAGPPAGAEMVADGVWKCPTDTTGAAYVGSSKSDKFHYLTCSNAKKIADHNRLCFASREAAVAYGYQFAGCCHP